MKYEGQIKKLVDQQRHLSRYIGSASASKGGKGSGDASSASSKYKLVPAAHSFSTLAALSDALPSKRDGSGLGIDL